MKQILKDEVINKLKWRNIGPPRGGRTVAVTGHPTNINEYYNLFLLPVKVFKSCG